jgi:hypothetical protein
MLMCYLYIIAVTDYGASSSGTTGSKTSKTGNHPQYPRIERLSQDSVLWSIPLATTSVLETTSSNLALAGNLRSRPNCTVHYMMEGGWESTLFQYCTVAQWDQH